MEQSRLPFNQSNTQSIAASSTETIELPIGEESWRIKSIDITLSTNGSISVIRIDGKDIGLIAENNDLEAEFGGLVAANESVEVDIENSNTVAEDNTVEAMGIVV